jgi:hypothetical protein
LAQTIHRALGPGRITLSHAPTVAGPGIARTSAGWSLVAPAAGVVATVTQTGALVVRSGAHGAAGTFSAMSIGWLGGGDATPLRPRSTTVMGGRLVQNMGPAQTWYQVAPSGLEQGFTVTAPPAGHGGQLVVGLGSATGWTLGSAGASLVRSAGAGGLSLLYDGLHVTDAAGAVLPAVFRIAHGTAEIVVRAPLSRSSFPIVIDPTWKTSSTPTATLTASSSVSAGFSVSMSSDGTTALVGSTGASSGAGAAYVFHTSAANAWATSSTPTATLTVSTGSSGDALGSSVSLSSDGTTALVGASGVSSGTGAAYVFQASAENAWSSTSSPTTTLSSSGSAGDAFGASTSFSDDGTTALVGASGVTTGTGAAYVFQAATEIGWGSVTTPTATLSNGSGSSGDHLGTSAVLSSDGTLALVGSPGASSGAGAVDVFGAASETSWATTTSPAVLSNSSGSAGDNLGQSIALSSDGTTALLGAPGVSSGAGAAYVYQASAENAWAAATSPTNTLTNSSGAAGDGLGTSVDISGAGNMALVGASGAGSGVADVFAVANESSWSNLSTPTAMLTNAAGSASDALGDAVSLSNDGLTALIGADGVSSGAGASYVFHVPVIPTTPSITNLPASGTYGGGFTATVSTTGDGTKSVTSSTTGVCTASGLNVSYVGTGSCVLIAHVAAGTNYAAASGTEPGFTVNPAGLTITASTTNSTYGSTPPTPTAQYSAFANGDTKSSLTTQPTCVTSATASTPAGTDSGANTCSGAVDSNYSFTYVAGDDDVGTATLTVTASNTNNTYGSTPPTPTPQYSGFVNNEDSSVVTTAPTCVTSATATTSVGTDTGSNTCSGGAATNYNLSYVAGNDVVGPATLTVTASTTNFTYGSTPQTPTPLYSGFVNNENSSVVTTAPTCSTTATATTPAGTDTAANSCSGGAATNYTLFHVTGNAIIAPAPLLVTASNTNSTYGSTPPTPSPLYSGFVNGQNASVVTTQSSCATSATVMTPVGTDSNSNTCSGGAATNYTLSYAPGSDTVGPAALTVTAQDTASVFGQAPPTPTAQITGFANGETSSVLTTQPTCSDTTVTPSSSPGTYSGSNVCSGAAATNYTFNYVAGSDTVANAVLTVTASTTTMTYGQSPVPQPTVQSITGFVNGQNSSVITTQPTCTTSALPTTDIGVDLNANTCSGGSAPGYAFNYVPNNATINVAPLTVTASNTFSTYFAVPPTPHPPDHRVRERADHLGGDDHAALPDLRVVDNPCGNLRGRQHLLRWCRTELHVRRLQRRHPDRRPGHPDVARYHEPARERGGR